MDIVTPTEITHVAWEGELVAPPLAMRTLAHAKLVATLGQPEIWTAADAMKTQVGQEWKPPLGGADYWLVRLACTLRRPADSAITQATQTLYLRPHNSAAEKTAAYAMSLFPDRLGMEDKAEFNASLKPALKFTPVELGPGEIGAKITYRKVFPVIQSYGAGEPTAYWIFKPHAAYPLEGTQFVYAVVAAKPGSNGARASVEMIVTTETRFGPVRLGLPEEAKAHVSFSIP
jgi:hypothetical protein